MCAGASDVDVVDHACGSYHFCPNTYEVHMWAVPNLGGVSTVSFRGGQSKQHYRVIGGIGSLGGVRTNVFVKMKVNIIFDRHTHGFFLGENGKNTLSPIPNLSSSSHMHSVIEPAFRCTFGSKWSEDVTFSQQFAVFSTWDVAHRGLWMTSQWPPMPLPTANRSTKWPKSTGGRTRR